MIMVVKPADPPGDLGAGAAETTANCASYDATPAAYCDGSSKFKFEKKIYGTADVKAALKRAQFDKCCYCEAVFDANYAGDVEHYRPKGAIGAGKLRVRPGYYWLAYEWDNLFYACADCNQYRKLAAFPLADETKRARNHHDLVAHEDPLILDPGGPRDPRNHIRFNRDVPTWKTTAGCATVSLLKLDREALCASRRKHFRLLEALILIIQMGRGRPEPDKIQAVACARTALRACMAHDAEFSAATQDLLIPLQTKWGD